MAKLLKRFFSIVFITASAFLVFVSGGLTSFVHHEVISKAYVSFYQNVLLARSEIDQSTWWHEAREASTGVVAYDQTRAQDGVTLYTSGAGQKAVLIDMRGQVRHEWRLPFAAAWGDAGRSRVKESDQAFYWDGVHLYPNGDLLANYVTDQNTPYGYGLVKMTKDSEILWAYPGKVHHHFTVARDGKIYAVSQRLEREAIPGIKRASPPFLNDTVVVLTPDGEVLHEISVLEALRDSDFAGILDFLPRDPTGDYIHVNEAEVIEPEVARTQDFLEAGQVMVSLRDMDLVVVIDPATARVVWALQGGWRRQHDPDFLANGNLLVFDNRGNLGPGGRSRVIEVDPVSQEVAWVYRGTADQPFQSDIRSQQQRLANGNTLIVESNQGRVFEVTPDKAIVWDFRNPSRAGQDGQLVAVLGDVHRLDRRTLTFLGDFVAGVPRHLAR